MTAAACIRFNRERIISEWVERVKKDIPAAGERPRPELLDTLPSAIDNLVEILDPGMPRGAALSSDTRALEHGAERARLTAYSLAHVLQEYDILREVILEILDEHGGATEDERHIIRAQISNGIRDAAAGFTQEVSEARERFVMTLAHDLRGPLTAAKASVQMILKASARSDRRRRFAGKAAESLDRLDTMIRDLLDFNRAQAGARLHLNVSRSDLKGLVERCIQELRMSHADRIILKAASSPLEGFWDSEALRRAVHNLIDNALKYGEPGTPVTVTLSATQGSMFILVHNEGNPIAAEDQKNLFAMHRRIRSTSNRSKGGWGLGLTLAKAVTEAHGGSLALESSVHKGTTFIMNFPEDARPYQA